MWSFPTIAVLVGVLVGVLVAVLVQVGVALEVLVRVGVRVGVLVLVAVLVGVLVLLLVVGGMKDTTKHWSGPVILAAGLGILIGITAEWQQWGQLAR